MKEGRVTEQDLDALMAEIEALPAVGIERNITLTPLQDQCLLALRNRGVSWEHTVEWWKGKGWPGAEKYLRHRYKELTAEPEDSS